MFESISLLDGEYYYEDYLETFGDGGLDPLLLPLRLAIHGAEVVADFTGAAPQAPVPVNSTLGDRCLGADHSEIGARSESADQPRLVPSD